MKSNSLGMAIAASLLLGAPALASGEPTAAAKSTELDEIVVTATRSGQSQQDVPASITTRDLDALQASGWDDNADEFRAVPGIFVRRESEDYSTVNIRGVTGQHGNDTFLALIDGIPLISIDEEVSFNDVPYAAVDRIEIVRGPMSTLYGRGAIGGAVNYLLREPTTDANRVSLALGSDGYRRTELLTERSFDNSAILLALSEDAADGWRDNSEKRRYSLFTKYVHNLGDTATMTAYLSHFDRKLEVPSLIPTLPDGTPVEVSGGRAGFNGYGSPRVDTTSTIAALRFNKMFADDISWTTTANYRWHDSQSVLNFYDASGFDPDNSILAVNGFNSPNDNRFFNLESTLAWKFGRHDIIVGANYERVTAQEENFWSGQFGFTFACGFAFYRIDIDYRTGQVVNADHPCFEVDRLQSANNAVSRFYGLFVQDQIELNERWFLTLGARYDSFKRDVEFLPTGPFNPGGTLAGDESALSPKAALSWRYDGGQVYVSYGRGFNSNFGPLFEWDPGQYARDEKPTTIDSVELGWKGQAMDGRLRFETALFALVQKNRRVVIANPEPGGPSSLSTTGQRYESSGFEAAVVYAPTEATSIAATFTWLDPEWAEYIIQTSGGPLDLSGTTPTGVPSHMASIDAGHRFNDWFAARAVYEWYGDYQVNQINTVEKGSYGLLTLQASITPPNYPGFSLDLAVENALDRDYGYYFGNQNAATSFSPGAPRQFRATLRWSF